MKKKLEPNTRKILLKTLKKMHDEMSRSAIKQRMGKFINELEEEDKEK